jgi:hypothetical protein
MIVHDTWLLRTGWRRHGLVAIDELPAAAERTVAADRVP